MNQTKFEKDFDCLKFKEQVQEKIAADIQNLTPSEEIEYYRVVADSSPLGEWWKSVKRKGSSTDERV